MKPNFDIPAPYCIPGLSSRSVTLLSQSPDPYYIVTDMECLFMPGEKITGTRKKKSVAVRNWSMLILLCLGYNHRQAAAVFNLDRSTCLVNCSNLCREIEAYPDKKKLFEDLVNKYGIAPRTDRIKSQSLKKWITTNFQ